MTSVRLCPPGPNSHDQCQTARRLDLMDQTPVTSVRLPAVLILWTKLPCTVSDSPPSGSYGPNSRAQRQTARRLDLMDQTLVHSVRLPAAWILWTKLPCTVSDCLPPHQLFSSASSAFLDSPQNVWLHGISEFGHLQKILLTSFLPFFAQYLLEATHFQVSAK